MDAIEALKTRRSCRSFTDEPLKKEDLDTILACGLNAPSGSNKQDTKIIVVQDKEKIRRLSELAREAAHQKSDPLYGAPVVCLVVAPKDSGYDEAPYQMNPMKNGSLVIGAMQTAAYALNIGSCWINTCLEMLKLPEGQAILKEFGLEEYYGVGCCILGYPKKMSVPKKIRKNRVFFF